MRWSQYSIPTLREDPSDAEVVSHRLLVRAGFIRQLAAGLYSTLPLAQRSLLKITQIIREEMNAIGGQEFYLPALHPAELWQESGRWAVMGESMFRLKDRKGGDYCLGMTHEEVFTDIARRELRSYKQLPQVWYQIQSKFRDEPRPKSGLLRVRQFTMKDAYSFNVDWEGLNSAFEDQRGAYKRIYDRCGLEYVIVDADSGAMGGKDSNEFMVYTDAGEDLVASCAKCGYAANTEKATSRLDTIDDGETASELDRPEQFETPGVRTIQDLISFEGGAPANRQIKTLVYTVTGKRGAEETTLPVLALVRGDHAINEVKLVHAVTRMLAADKWELHELRAATEDEIVQAMGAHAGSLGAVGVKGHRVIADEGLRGRKNMTTGANVDDVHVRGVSLDRDISVSSWEDIRLVVEGDGCPKCDGTLRVAKALEVGHIFKLGTKYSESMGARVLTAEGKEVPIIMGCYGIGVERILAAAVELHNDEAGIIFPVSIAPFQLVISPLNVKDGEMLRTAEGIYREAQGAGIEAVLDDREERAGVKLNDADLVGFPFRITIGPRKLKEGKVELYDRSKREAEDVTVGDAVRIARERIDSALRKLEK